MRAIGALYTVYTLRVLYLFDMFVYVSINDRNVRFQSKHYSFPRKHALRFEWFAYLALSRKQLSGGEGWVSIEQIQSLPLWKGKSKQHVGTNVGRYIQALKKSGLDLIEARSQWRGPYRLKVPAAEITFDIPLREVADYLGVVRQEKLRHETLYYFTQQYCRAISLYLKGTLSPNSQTKKRQHENALGKLYELSSDTSLDARLRLFTNLAAVRALGSLGRSSAAELTLNDSKKLLRHVKDRAIISKFYLAEVWRYYKTGDNNRFETSLSRSKALAAKTEDLSLSASISNLEGLRLSSKGDYSSAIEHLLLGLNLRLFTENFDSIQASCFNVGNTFQRMGLRNYSEAEKWLRLCIDICKWMNIGRYEATAEIILSKIALESGRISAFLKWVKEAESFALRSGNPSDRMWCAIMRAFHSQKLKNLEATLDHLVDARRIYLTMSNWKTPDKYLQRKFPEVWEDVINLVPNPG
jgi:hypothetical protein